MEGVLLLHKPKGPTSHDMVDQIRLLTGERRVGHAGTLDPMAEGLLIMLIGRGATKHQAAFMAQQKTYEAELTLGAVSDTDDAEGTITSSPALQTKPPTKKQVQGVLDRFQGEIEQVPPLYSAINIGGKRAYALARSGKRPTMQKRTVVIDELTPLSYRYPLLRIRVTCSKGTYIRALARDIGAALGTGAYLSMLLRTRSGSFALDQAVMPDTLTPETVQAHLAKTEQFL